jgi:hypothetical protein
VQYVDVKIPEPDLPDVWKLLLNKHATRAAAPATAPSVASSTSHPTDNGEGNRNNALARVWNRVMPGSRAVIAYLVEANHDSEDNAIGYGELQRAAQIARLGGAVKSIHHQTKKAGLPDYALLSATVVNGKTVYWIEPEVADSLRTLI